MGGNPIIGIIISIFGGFLGSIIGDLIQKLIEKLWDYVKRSNWYTDLKDFLQKIKKFLINLFDL